MDKFKIRNVKIENFKSYKNFVFFGPLEISFLIAGQNGTGKTNFSESLVFGLGGTLEEINCYSIQNLFPHCFVNENFYFEAKIGLSLVNQKKNDITRIITIDNSSEFFLNGTKISFSSYKKILKKLRIIIDKNFFILKNLSMCRYFFSNFKLSETIDKISGSNKLSFFHLKLGLLKKKFQKDSLFYFQKLKFMTKEKYFLNKKLSHFFYIKKILLEFNCIGKNINMFIIFCIKLKLWSSSKKKNYKIRQKNEICIHNMCFFLSPIFSKKKIAFRKFRFGNFKDLCNNVRIFTKKFDSLNRDASLKKKNLITLNYRMIIEKERFFYRKNKKIDSLNITINKFIFHEIIQLLVYYTSKFDFFRIKNQLSLTQKSTNFFFFFLKKDLNSIKNSNEISLILTKKKHFFSKIFFLDLIKKIFEIKKNFFFSNKKKIFQSIFYIMGFLLFILLEIKIKQYENFIHKKKKIENKIFISLKSSVHGIRGKFFEIFKPIDSKFKKFIQATLKKKKDYIIVDNFKTASFCITFVQKKKNFKFFFVTAKNLSGSKIFYEKKSFEKKKIKLNSIVDFDIYDLNVLSFFSEKIMVINVFQEQSSFKFLKNQINFCLYKDITIQKSDVIIITFNPRKKQEKIMKANFYQNLVNKKIFSLDFLNSLSFTMGKINFLVSKNVEIFKKFFSPMLNQENSKNCLFSAYFLYHHRFSVDFLKKKRSISKKSMLFNSHVNIYYLKFGYLRQKTTLRFIFQKYEKNLNFLRLTRFSYKYFRNIFQYKNKKKHNFQMLFKKKKKSNKKNNLNKIGIFCIFFYFEFFFWQKITEKCQKKIIKNEKIKNLHKKRQNCLKNFIFSMKDLYLRKIKVLNNQIFQKKKYISKIGKFFFSSKIFCSGFLFFSCSNHNKRKEHCFCNRKNLNLFYFFNFFKYEKKIRKAIRKNFCKKKSDLEKKVIETKKKKFLQKRYSFVNTRYKLFKKKLIQSKYRFLVSNSKFLKTEKERQKRFNNCFSEINRQTNKIYKNITQSFLYPQGGTAFLTKENEDRPFYGKVFFTAIPPSKSLQKIQNMSGGEKTIAAISLMVCLIKIYGHPFILFDEVDSFLDSWYSHKFFSFLKNLSEKNKIQICVISLKLKFFIFFKSLICVFKDKFTTNSMTLTFKEYNKNNRTLN